MKTPKLTTKSQENGFTIIEVMLVLALTGMLLVGLLGGTFSSIARQRYNDSVRDFAEYLRTVYSEVISPESMGQGNSKNYAVYGKALVFGYDYKNADDNRRVYSATLIGSPEVPRYVDGGFVNELASVGVELYCGQKLGGLDSPSAETTVDSYEPLWQAELAQINDKDKGLSINNRFVGTIIIAKSPTSGVVHTVYTDKVYKLNGECSPTNSGASAALKQDIKNYKDNFLSTEVKFQMENIGICVKSENSAVWREVVLSKDGHNTSAVSILNTDVEDPLLGRSKCND